MEKRNYSQVGSLKNLSETKNAFKVTETLGFRSYQIIYEYIDYNYIYGIIIVIYAIWRCKLIQM